MSRKSTTANFIEQHNTHEQITALLRKSKDKTFSLNSDSELMMMILSIQPNLRSSSMLRVLHETMSNLPFFEKKYHELQKDSYEMLLQHSMLEKFQKNQPIIQIGETGNKFYFILKGSCYVMLPRTGIKVEKEDEKKFYSSSKRILHGAKTALEVPSEKSIRNKSRTPSHYASMEKIEYEEKTAKSYQNPSMQHFEDEEEEEEEVQLEQIGVNDTIPFVDQQLKRTFGVHHYIAGTMKSGNSFGEIALREPKAKRTATVVAAEDCVLISLAADDYNAILRESHQAEIEKQVSKLKDVYFLQNWTRLNVNELLMQLQPASYKSGAALVKENSVVNSMFIIKNGQVELNRTVTILKNGFFRQREKGKYSLDGLVKEFTSQENLEKGRENYNLNMKSNEKTNEIRLTIKVTTLVENDYFGEEMIWGLPSNLRVEVLSGQCDVYWITKKKFNMVIRSEETLKLVETAYHKKATRRSQALLDNVLTHCIRIFGDQSHSNYNIIMNTKAFHSPLNKPLKFSIHEEDDDSDQVSSKTNGPSAGHEFKSNHQSMGELEHYGAQRENDSLPKLKKPTRMIGREKLRQMASFKPKKAEIYANGSASVLPRISSLPHDLQRQQDSNSTEDRGAPPTHLASLQKNAVHYSSDIKEKAMLNSQRFSSISKGNTKGPGFDVFEVLVKHHKDVAMYNKRLRNPPSGLGKKENKKFIQKSSFDIMFSALNLNKIGKTIGELGVKSRLTEITKEKSVQGGENIESSKIIEVDKEKTEGLVTPGASQELTILQKGAENNGIIPSKSSSLILSGGQSEPNYFDLKPKKATKMRGVGNSNEVSSAGRIMVKESLKSEEKSKRRKMESMVQVKMQEASFEFCPKN